MVAMMIEAAGPQLTPDDVQAGVQGLPALTPSGNSGPYFGTRGLHARDFTWNDNFREIYFSPTQGSPYDGVPGRYVSLGGGHWGTYPSGLLALPPKPR